MPLTSLTQEKLIKHSLTCWAFIPAYLTWGFPSWHSGKESTCQCRRPKRHGSSLAWEDPLEEEMATHSSILAWKIPWTEEPRRESDMNNQLSTRATDLAGGKFQPFLINLSHLKIESTCEVHSPEARLRKQG